MQREQTGFLTSCKELKVLMSKEICIHSWPGSYYLNAERRWVYGHLELCPSSLLFLVEKTGDMLLCLQLSDIVEIKKESSSFIFSSITILEKGNVKHWFSSLQPNRTVVFNTIEHFWKEQLLSPGGVGAASPTSKGKQLINLVTGSQRRLEDTAKVLHHQGEQFNNVMEGLDKIECDLDTADRLLTGLESPSWWPFSNKPWRVQQESKRRDLGASAPKTPGKDGVIVRVPVIFLEGADSSRKPGDLTVLVSALEIRDSNSRILHRYRREDVDEIKVYSPYEINIRQRFIGKPDLSYRLLSAKMQNVICVLELQYKKNIEFLWDPLELKNSSELVPSDVSCSLWHSDKSEHLAEGDGQVQVQQQQTVSDAEAQELKQMLMKLKTIAFEAEAELDRQSEVLGVIADSTDRATVQIDKHNRRIKKLM
ncbi:synaptosomal-associated protein 47 isoform X4 [Protopterus annectens]|uniref:synaptosomal-associated protein 47 isoform X4 n=1 Tax=Protopterus annectens TaxID=7888 RepID=UPI001CFA9891|nr:synaptosomal-associated protein 47 isoform X4 [Protopterus annectens]